MDFVLWVSRAMHGISAVLWVGGLVFINVVVNPALEHEGVLRGTLARNIRKGFFPFIWYALWTMLVTGLLLMVLSPRFIWLDLSTLWSRLLLVKEGCFVLLAFTSWQLSRVGARLDESGGTAADFEAWSASYQRLLRRSIGLGLVSLLCAAGMAVS